MGNIAGTWGAEAVESLPRHPIRLVPRLEDCARRMALLGRKKDAWKLLPAVLCAEEGSMCAEFWDTEDLVRWVASRWAGRLVCRRREWEDLSPDLLRLPQDVEFVESCGAVIGAATDLQVLRAKATHLPKAASPEAAVLRRPGLLDNLEELDVWPMHEEVLPLFADVLDKAGRLPAMRTVRVKRRYAPSLEGFHTFVAAISVAGKLPRLRVLEMDCKSLDDEDVRALSAAVLHMPRLQELRISSPETVTSAGIRWLCATVSTPGALRVLRLLDLDMVRLDADAVLYVADAIGSPGALPALQTLRLPYSNAAEMAPLSAAISRPGVLPQLRCLELLPLREPADRLRWHVAAMTTRGAFPHLRVLHFEFDVVDGETMRDFTNAIRERGALPAAESLSFADSLVSAEGMRCFAAAVADGTLAMLREIDLGGTRVDLEGVRYFSEAISSPGVWPLLAVLRMHYMPLGLDGVRAFSDAIRKPAVLPSLRELNLAGSRLDAACMRALCTALALPGTLPALQVLLLDKNKFGAEGARHLADAIGAPGALRSLRRLDLFRCDIGPEGMRWLSGALAKPTAVPRLQTLNLRDCELGPEGLRRVGEAIGSPGALARLEELDLSMNPAPVGGLNGLLTCLRVPGALPAVRVIDIRYNANFYDEHYVQHIAAVIGTPGVLPSLEAFLFRLEHHTISMRPVLDARQQVRFEV
jgi:Leucine Rich repeat